MSLEKFSGMKFLEYEIFPGFIVFRFENKKGELQHGTLAMKDIEKEMSEVAKEDYNDYISKKHP